MPPARHLSSGIARRIGKISQGEPQPDLAVRAGSMKLLSDYDGLNPRLFDLAVDPRGIEGLGRSAAGNSRALGQSGRRFERMDAPDRGPELGAKADKVGEE